MRTHASIIEEAGGVATVRKGLLDAGLELPDATVRAWPARAEGVGSIPPEYWPTFVQLGWTTLEELAAATEARRFPDRAMRATPEAVAP